jgi:hypothetical protein
MADNMLLVGSIPYDTAEEVFDKFGMPLASDLIALPDGEVGLRSHWISRIHYQVFAVHPDVEIIRRPQLEAERERLNPRDASDSWQFAVKDGVQRIRFGDQGWRLGYARDALTSYFVFKTKQEKGELPHGLRFQVSVASPNSAAPPRLFSCEADCEIVREAYLESLVSELRLLCARIPHSDLAIQFDCATEVQDAYGAIPGRPQQGGIERNQDQIRALAPHIPPSVALGYHLCFGTLGGWPRFAPDDLSATVDLANAFIEASGRRVDWVHIPTLDRVDDHFYEPLSRLRPAEAKVFLGMIHHMETFEQRLAVARRWLPNFGLAAYCGLGRTPQAGLASILREHMAALAVVRTPSLL